MTDLNTMTTKQLVEYHNAFPNARQLTVKTFNKKALYIAAIEDQRALVAEAATKLSKKNPVAHQARRDAAAVANFLTPADIANQMKISAYEVRVKLRAARAAGIQGLADKNQRWQLSPATVAKIFTA